MQDDIHSISTHKAVHKKGARSGKDILYHSKKMVFPYTGRVGSAKFLALFNGDFANSAFPDCG